YESAALDLALRQADTSLHEALGREPRPVRFVVSLRLGEPPSLEPLRERLNLYPGLRFKLDPTSSWDEELITELVATGAVDAVDFKGYYVGSIVDQPAGLDRGPGLDRGDGCGARPPSRALLMGRADPLDRGHPGAALPTAHGQHQALAPGWPAQPARRLRLLRRALDRQLRRRAVRARHRPRAEPVSGLAVPRGRPQRRRPDRLQPTLPARRTAREPAGPQAV